MKKENMADRQYQLEAIELMKEIDKILSENDIWYSLAYGSVLGAVREKGFIEWDRDVDIVIKKPDQERVRTLLEENLSEKYCVESCKRDTISSFDVVLIKNIYSGGMHVDIYPLIGGPDDQRKGYRFQLKCRRIHKLCICKYLDTARIINKLKVPFVYLIRGVEHLIPDCLIRQYIDKVSMKYNFYESRFFFPFSNDGKRGEYMEGELLFNTQRVLFETLMLPIPQNSEEYLSRLYGSDYLVPKKY